MRGKPTSIYLEDDVRRILDARTPPGSSRSRTLGLMVRRFDEIFRAPASSVGRERDVPADRVERRRMAKVIAASHEGVDEGDVEHALSNMLLPPRERLRRRISRAAGIRTPLK